MHDQYYVQLQLTEDSASVISVTKEGKFIRLTEKSR